MLISEAVKFFILSTRAISVKSFQQNQNIHAKDSLTNARNKIDSEQDEFELKPP